MKRVSTAIAAGFLNNQLTRLSAAILETEWQFAPSSGRLLEEGMKSYCAVPMKLGGKVIGTLNVGSDAKAQYSDADAEFLYEVQLSR